MIRRSGLPALLLSDETSRRAFEETIGDWRQERAAAVSHAARLLIDAHLFAAIGRVFLGGARRDLAHWSLWRSVGACVLLSTLMAVLNPLTWTFGFTRPGHWFEDAVSSMWLLIPNSAILFFLLATAAGVGVKRERQPQRLLGHALVAFLLAFMVTGWVTPAGNLAFRERMWAIAEREAPAGLGPRPAALRRMYRGLSKAIGDASLSELVVQAAKDPFHQPFVLQAMSGRMAFSLGAPVAVILGAAIRRRLRRVGSWRLIQISSGAAASAIAVVAGYLASILRQLFDWVTATRLERLQLDLWLA